MSSALEAYVVLALLFLGLEGLLMDRAFILSVESSVESLGSVAGVEGASESLVSSVRLSRLDRAYEAILLSLTCTSSGMSIARSCKGSLGMGLSGWLVAL